MFQVFKINFDLFVKVFTFILGLVQSVFARIIDIKVFYCTVLSRPFWSEIFHGHFSDMLKTGGFFSSDEKASAAV